MNRFLSLFSALCLALALQAQDGPQTLFGTGDFSAKRIGVALTPMINYNRFDGADAAVAGLRGGVVFADKFSVGGFYLGSLGDISTASIPADNYLDVDMAGGFVEYTLFADKLLHFSFPLLIGAGEIELDERSGPDIEETPDRFIMLEPSLQLELNLHRYVRLQVGAGYRFTDRVERWGLSNSDIGGFSAGMGLRVGLFR